MVVTRSQLKQQQLEEQEEERPRQQRHPKTNAARASLANRLLLVAACVRTAYLLLVVALAHLLEDFDTSASLLSDSCADDWPEQAAAAQQYLPGVVWDSVFLHRVAACGYEYEQFYAFYPGVPGLAWLVRQTGLLPGPWGFAITVLTLNTLCFLASVWLLTKLGERLVGEPRVVATAVLFFVASPASIHHSMLYTEALFTTTSWLGLYCLYCWESSLGASLAFAASAAVRSNGLLNAGFILHEHGRRVLVGVSKRHWASVLKNVCTALFCTVISVAPYFAYMLLSYREFCTGVYGGKGSGPYEPRPWCSNTIPSAYGYVQKVYWHVGFLKYYRVNQIPNFILAGPVLVMSLWGALAYAAANPHVFVTGGLLTKQQLQGWFGGGGGSSSSKRGGSSSSCGCCRLPAVVVGRAECCSSSGDSGRSLDEADAGAFKSAVVQGLSTPQQSLHLRQQPGARQHDCERAAAADGLLDSQTGTNGSSSQRRQHGGCSCGSNAGYYRPEQAVFVIHWLVLTLVCLAVVHIQVATRFLSSCAPLYWFAAMLMLHKGGLLRWLLWWYCLAYMGVGAVMFINFYPWV